jgi:hypothetical protein
VPTRADTNLKLAAFYLCHTLRISRIVTSPELAMENVHVMPQLKEHKDDHNNQEDPKKLTAHRRTGWPFLNFFTPTLLAVLEKLTHPTLYVILERMLQSQRRLITSLQIILPHKRK